MRVLLFLILVFGLNIFANAQACGAVNLSVFVTNKNGQSIKNAKFKFFDKKFKTEDNYYDGLPWVNEMQGYHSIVGMGTRTNIGLRISAEGFEKFEKVIDLPMGWTTYSVKLAQTNSKDLAEAIKLTHFNGKIIDENEALIIGAKLEITDSQGKKYFTTSDLDGWFDIDLPLGKYTAKVSQNGFKDLKLINFNIENSQRIYLDLKLKARNCDDCKGSIYGKSYEKPIQEVILDYQKIKEKY